MQSAYIKVIYELLQKDKRVISLLSDSGGDYDTMMAREMPDQCYNLGIAENNQVGIAAGMALQGLIPFVYAPGNFLAYRSYEFIRNDVCYQNQNVKFIAMGSGTVFSTMGPSHHSTEDLSCLRALPNLTILSPATPKEAAACVQTAYEIQGPVYIRLGKGGEPEFFDDNYRFQLGKAVRMTEGSNVAVFTTGAILCEVMEAERLLREQGIGAAVFNMPSIKPLDEEAILEAGKDFHHVVTVEEHNIYGGLGGAVAEVLAESGTGTKLKRIGLRDCFAKGYGTQADVRKNNGLDAQAIAAGIADFVR